MTAAAALAHPLGPRTMDDWLAADPPADGSRLELILGYFHVSPPPSGRHQRVAFRLARVLEDTFEAAGRDDLHVVPAVGIKISTPWRTALIPDVAVLDVDPDGPSFAPEHLVLAVEVWSPGNTWEERETKLSAYAGASVPFVWTVDFPKGKGSPLQFRAYQLVGGGYREETFVAGGMVTSAPAPVPVSFDIAYLG